MNITKVSIGWTSIIGYLLTVAAAIPIVVETINNGLIAFKTGGIYALAVIVLGGITTLIRGLQAKAKINAHAMGVTTHTE